MFTPLGPASVPQPQTLVATALPNSTALRVPSDNVAPSVSSAELSNNASGNRATKTKAAPQIIAASTQIEKYNTPTANVNTGFSASSQAGFLAQLASGDISSEVHGIFAQYEKLLSYANVKYKPSNAGKPSDTQKLFATIMELEKTGVKYEAPEIAEPAIEELPEAAIKIDDFKIPAPELAREIPAQVKAAKYVDTIIRNTDISPHDIELA